jgi:tetratricopeptide (TPR) repeat protein
MIKAVKCALAVAATLSVAQVGCSRNAIEAVNLANEGDKARDTNIDDAISKYDQASKLDPDNHRILWKLARAYKKKEAWDKVATTCAKAEAADEKMNKKKTFAEYYFLHGYALEQQAAKGGVGWAEAKGPLQTAFQIDPNFAQAYFELAEVLLHSDDEQGAMQNYSKAIEVKPDELQFYAPLADLYMRLNFNKEAEGVLREGLTYAKEGDKHLFGVHALLGNLLEFKNDMPGAINEYEAAKKACAADQCNDHKEAYFLLGTAYAAASPPRKNEAVQELQRFWKVTCKGSLAQRYEAQCSQAREISTRLGTPLQ